MGKMASSFKLEFKNSEKSDHMLEAGLAESGYLEKGEYINYWYREDTLKEKTNITLQMHAMSGSNTMRFKFCSAERDIERSRQQCSHTKEDLLKPEENEKQFINIGKEVIEHDPSTCNQANPILGLIRYEPPTCMYNIGIIGTSDGKNHYGVTLRHQEGHHVLLSEGKIFEGSLTQGDYEYYKVSIHDDAITSLTIQLLSIHGDPDMFLSQKDEYPTEEKFERKATICGKFPDTIYFATDNQTQNLVGDYYIGIFGFTESSYHLYYHTERTHTEENGTESKIKLPVKMQQGKPVRGVLRSKEDYLLYKFNIANATNEEEIIVRLTPENGKFKYAVKLNEQATKEKYDKVGGLENHYTVVFNPVKEEKYKQGEFNIFVYPVITNDMDVSGMSYTFLLNYYIGSHHIPLLNDQPTLGFMSTQKINYYSYAFRSEVDEIKLTVTKVAGDVEFIVSLNQAITFPTWDDVNPEKGVYKTTSEKNTFSKQKINAFCQHDDYGYCIMTIAVRPTQTDKESQYVLTAKALKVDESPITKIENGVPQHGSAKAEEWQYFYYKTSNAQPITAVVVPNGGDPNIYVSMVTDLELNQNEWERPTRDKYLKKSEDSIGADILMITKDDLKD